jgi:hypothetical protein
MWAAIFLITGHVIRDEFASPSITLAQTASSGVSLSHRSQYSKYSVQLKRYVTRRAVMWSASQYQAYLNLALEPLFAVSVCADNGRFWAVCRVQSSGLEADCDREYESSPSVDKERRGPIVYNELSDYLVNYKRNPLLPWLGLCKWVCDNEVSPYISWVFHLSRLARKIRGST